MKTAVVILNWNTREYLERFLPALTASVQALDACIVVADSASTDGSVEMMKERFPDIRTIALDRNYGFVGGYNRALSRIDAEYYVLINSDIEVTPGWLGPLVRYMDTHPECACTGPKLMAFADRRMFEYAGAAGGLLDRWGYPFCRGRKMKRIEADHGQYDDTADVMWVSGACMCVRAEVWKQLGGLDGRFFAHMEEIDFCWRAQLHGWKVSVVPQSSVYHIGGGTLPLTSPLKLKLNFRNNLLMLWNNLASTYALKEKSNTMAYIHAGITIFWRMILDGCSSLVYLLGGHRDYFKAVITAHREFRQMRGKMSLVRGKAHSIDGWYKGSILLDSLIHKTNENSY